jgi:hypothetical protein
VDSGEEVQFAGSYIDPDEQLNDDVIIEWDFGDGESATGTLTPTHTYNNLGTYIVTLTVIDDEGSIGADKRFLTVLDTDGYDDDIEDRAPNGGDGNNDGISDSQQSHVASLPNCVDGGYL